jgi:hypothetical protein
MHVREDAYPRASMRVHARRCGGEHRQMSKSANSEGKPGGGRCVSATAYWTRRRRCSRSSTDRGGGDGFRAAFAVLSLLVCFRQGNIAFVRAALSRHTSAERAEPGQLWHCSRATAG